MARYRNAADVLPRELLAAIQRYCAGTQIYVPRATERRAWGERSGTRESLRARNALIQRRYREGVPIPVLMAEFHLGYDSIRKIVGGKNESTQSVR